MYRILLTTIFILFSLATSLTYGQACSITAVNATAQACDGDYFFVSINIEAENTSPGFTLAGNGTIYGTFLYDDLPILVGPFLGDDLTVYNFIAWDVETPTCQASVQLPASNCGVICDFSNVELHLLQCINDDFAQVELDFDHQGTTNPAFDVFYENGEEVNSWLYESLPVTINSFRINGADPIILTICDNNNPQCCETFELDAIDCDTNDCEIYNLNIDPECTGSNFVVHIDFDFTNVASDSFTVTGNSLNYGRFGYNELPITLGPLNGGTNIMWEFVIRDSELPGCSKTGVLGLYNCPPPCNMLSLSAVPGICSGDTGYSLTIDVEIEGEGDNGFSVFSDHEFYGSFEYDNLPITLPSVTNYGDIVDLITVCDNEEDGCCTTLEYEALDCSVCIIDYLHAIPQPCNDQNEFMVVLDFYFHNVTDSFFVSGNQMQFGPFPYNQVPIVLGPYNGNGDQVLEFVVTDQDSSFCFGSLELGVLGCDDICSLSNLQVETGDCTGPNEYTITVDFDFENVTGGGFDLFANGEFFGFYNYADLPLTIENFTSSGNDLDTIQVCDNDNGDCCATLVFEAVACECDIFEASVTGGDCTSDSTFGIAVEFLYENLPGNFVDVFFDNEFIGFYSVLNMPLQIPNIPEGDGTGILRICANDLSTCCVELVIEQHLCEGPPCNIDDLFAETGECTSDSTFLLHIAFNSTLGLDDSVLVFGNDDFIGQFQVAPDFISIPNFPILGELTHLTVCSVEQPDCCESYTFVTPDCDTTNCEISGLVADPGNCLTDSTYVLVIEYNSDNVPGDSVNIFANGDFIGTFVDDDGHIVIEDFPWFDGDQALLTLCSVAFPDCCDQFEFEIPNCGPQPCNIFELDVNFEGCQSDSTYTVAINFETENLPSDSVIVTANGNYIGQFHHNNGHIVIQQFPIYATNHTVVTVCAVGAPDCCDVYEYETPFCPGGGCAIDINFIETGDCLTDSTYLLVVDFEFFGLPSDSVVITANEQFIGTFHINEGHIVIEHFPLLFENITVLHICALGNPDCCDVIEFETPDCDPECHIFDLVANFEGCESDSTYFIAINFESNNLPTDSVHITANGESLGNFHHSDGHILLHDFPIFQTNHTVITVCAVGAPDCCDVIEFETPVCDGSCHIFDLFAETGGCTSDSTFLVHIVFQSNNLPGDSVTVYAGNILLGNYFDHPDFITIENFPLQDGETTTITVCAVEAPDCCDTYVIENPECGGECDIFEMQVEVLDCTSDSTFGVVIDFQYENLSAGGFDVYTSGGYLGFFNLNEAPPVISANFPANSTGEYFATVCESDNLECCQSIEFEGPVCGEGICDIFNMEWSITECSPEGTFFFIIDFDFQNVGLEGFNVVGNGNNYGNFSYENLPIEIGPFETNNTVYEFLVIDAQNNTCFDFIEPGMVECIVGINEVSHEDIFEVYNNGSIPGIRALKEIEVSLFNANGKSVETDYKLGAGNKFDFTHLPNGIFIGTIIHEENIWSVKLIKTGY